MVSGVFPDFVVAFALAEFSDEIDTGFVVLFVVAELFTGAESLDVGVFAFEEVDNVAFEFFKFVELDIGVGLTEGVTELAKSTDVLEDQPATYGVGLTEGVTDLAKSTDVLEVQPATYGIDIAICFEGTEFTGSTMELELPCLL